jgi:tripartite-type tricarboxylate transporter receptor subunit TctC
MITRRTAFAAALIAAFALGTAGSAQTQTYPDRPIRLVLPFTAGSPNDVLARLVIPEVATRLGQTIVIENKPGGGTSIGTKAVMAAEPDGYTLLFSNTPTLIIVPAASKTINYDPAKDFVAIATIASSANVMVIAPSVPAKTVQEFVAYAKANPGKLNFGFGQGTQPHLVGELFKMVTKTDITSVPYRGGAHAITDMLGGRIHMNIGTMSTLKPLHEQGKVRAIAVTSTERSPLLPQIPTMAESGLPDVTSVSYYGIFGPAGLPAAIVTTINNAVVESLKSPALRANMERLGFTPHPGSPQDYAKIVGAESAKWVPVVKATGYQM